MRFVFLGLVLAMVSCDRSSGKIRSSESDLPRCRAALHAALEQIKGSQGLAIELIDADVDALVASGDLTKSYTRDAVGYSAGFGVDFEEGGTCSLRLASMSTRDTTGTTTRHDDFGQVRLDGCRCQRR
jgi:hypothetical protein